MNEIKKSFQSFIEGDKATLIFVLARIIVGFLFFITLFLPFIFEATIVNGKASLADFPGAFIFTVIIFLSIPAYFYFFLMKNSKLTKITLIVQAISSLLIYMYGILAFRVGFPDTATYGFGKHFGFVLLILMWVLFFTEELTKSLINDHILKQEKELVEEVK